MSVEPPNLASRFPGLKPLPPQWALNAGLPAPSEDEGFEQYVLRLGLDPEPLLAELNERTAVIANQRLATRIMRDMPEYFRAYLDARKAAVQLRYNVPT